MFTMPEGPVFSLFEILLDFLQIYVIEVNSLAV